MVAQLENLTVRIEGQGIAVRLASEDYGSSQVETLKMVADSLREICEQADERDVVVDVSAARSIGAGLLGILASSAGQMHRRGRRFHILPDRWHVTEAGGLGPLIVTDLPQRSQFNPPE